MHNKETQIVIRSNYKVININLEGLTHADSLASPEAGGNCINWILGHIIVSRDDMREILGLSRICSDTFKAKYSRGTKPIQEGDAEQFKDLFEMFKSTHKELEEKIGEVDFFGKKETLERLTFLAFHEAYHSGQTGLLRRVAGKDGAIK